MQLIVKILNGAEHSIQVPSELTIDELKKNLAEKLNIPKYQQRLMFKGKALCDTQKLSDYSITDGTRIHLSINKNAEPPVIESKLDKELKSIAVNYVKDVDKFTSLFNKELKRLVNEMSLDDIERYDEARQMRQEANL
ncbi:unnamed protein product [Brachionus calyciflorus]|uniref:Ubiquitin-like domain-containing protein n=1 Tax=Brachionus calyciflorus TaxID=104777 RepID=A0A814L8R7_9BILA|nr:unnamed protein product [Brachionus calyciflorus]